MVLLLFAGALAQDEQARAGVVFHIDPPYFRVYKQTLMQSMSAVPVTDGKAVLEFPQSFVTGNRQLTLRFSVKTWSGEYPDWPKILDPKVKIADKPGGIDVGQWDNEGFTLYANCQQMQGKNSPIPQGGTIYELPLPKGIAFQAWTVARPFQAFGALLCAMLLPIGLYKLGRKYRLATKERPLVKDYTLGRKLGEGGMGEVFAATSVQSVACALKFIKPEYADDQDFKERFDREVKVWKDLDHSNLLKLYGYGVATDGRLFTVSELLEGKTLKQVIASGDFDPPQLAGKVLEEIGDVLCYLHERQLVHRDVKPDNIFVCNTGTLKLMDMGLVRGESRTSANQAHLTQTGQVLGTPAYMPPEQMESTGRLTGAADQYALGIILYEILVGQRPFTQTDPVMLIYQHTRVAPPKPTEMNPRVTIEMEGPLLKMLAKKPGERYSSLREAQQALEFLGFTSWQDRSEETLH